MQLVDQNWCDRCRKYTEVDYSLTIVRLVPKDEGGVDTYLVLCQTCLNEVKKE